MLREIRNHQSAGATTGHASQVVHGSTTTADAAFDAHAHREIVVGRFGPKARIATLDDLAADAFRNDVAIATSLRFAELLNPDGRPELDAMLERVNQLATYMPAGQALFEQ